MVTDNIVEPHFGEEIFAKLKDPKQIWRIPDGHHGDVNWSHELVYRKKLLDWLVGEI